MQIPESHLLQRAVQDITPSCIQDLPGLSLISWHLENAIQHLSPLVGHHLTDRELDLQTTNITVTEKQLTSTQQATLHTQNIISSYLNSSL